MSEPRHIKEIEQVKAGEPTIGLYPRVNEQKYGPLFQDWRAKSGR